MIGHMEILMKVALTDQPEVAMAAMVAPGVTNQLVLFYPDGQPVMLNVQATPISSRPAPLPRLYDGRGVVSVQVYNEHGGQWFPSSIIPSPRPFWAIVADISTHGMMNPDHGFNCACLDAMAREMKQHVARGLPPMYDEGAQMYRSPEWAARFDAQRRLAHVMRMVVDSL